jgi:hypothetical protein
MESAPMKDSELGQFVCVAHGGCLHSPHRTIRSDGVWVKQGSGGPFSSAHRDCFDAWEASVARDVANIARAEDHPQRASYARQPVDPELFRRTAPQWNCVDYPANGPHYTPNSGCVWCGMTREQIAAEYAAAEAAEDDDRDQQRDYAEEAYNRNFCPACGASPCTWDGEPDGFHTDEPAEPPRVVQGESNLSPGMCGHQTAYGLPWSEYCAEPAGHDPEHAGSDFQRAEAAKAAEAAEPATEWVRNQAPGQPGWFIAGYDADPGWLITDDHIQRLGRSGTEKLIEGLPPLPAEAWHSCKNCGCETS